MRVRQSGLLSSTLFLVLALQGAPALASKPSEPPGKAKQQQQQPAKSRQQPAKVDGRGGQSRPQAVPNRAGFAASSGGSRDDDRRDVHDRDGRNDWRGDDRRWDRDHHDWDRNDHDWDRDDHDWDRDRRDWDRDHRDWDRDDDKRFYSYSRDNDRRYYYDRRVYDRYYYPRRGYIVPRLPYGYRVVQYYGVPYYFGGGSWYRPYGPSFTVVSPPIGLMVSFLPDVYTTLWIGGIPYYYANDVYYRWRPEHRAYIVTALPIG
jgi:hypothetical protein